MQIKVAVEAKTRLKMQSHVKNSTFAGEKCYYL